MAAVTVHARLAPTTKYGTGCRAVGAADARRHCRATIPATLPVASRKSRGLWRPGDQENGPRRNAASADGRSRPSGDGDAVSPDELRLELEPADAVATLRFAYARPAPRPARGDAASCLVLDAVAPGSVAESAGARAGMRLMAVSDPIRPAVLWAVTPASSLGFVCDAIRMRRGGPVALVLRPALSPSPWAPLSAAGDCPLPDGVPDAGLDTAGAVRYAAGALAALSRLETESEPVPESMPESRESVMSSPAVRRQRRREEYLEVVGRRDDRPLLLGLAAAVAGPPAAILGWAWGAGWLEPGHWLF